MSSTGKALQPKQQQKTGTEKWLEILIRNCYFAANWKRNCHAVCLYCAMKILQAWYLLMFCSCRWLVRQVIAFEKMVEGLLQWIGGLIVHSDSEQPTLFTV